MQRMTRQMIADINIDLENIEKGLEMNSCQIFEEKKKLQMEEERYSQQLSMAKNNINEKVNKMKSDTIEWIESLMYQMECENLTVYSVQEISQYYAYYCVELLETVLRECLETHREELMNHMSDISDELGKGLAGMYAAGDNIQFCFRLNNST